MSSHMMRCTHVFSRMRCTHVFSHDEVYPYMMRQYSLRSSCVSILCSVLHRNTEGAGQKQGPVCSHLEDGPLLLGGVIQTRICSAEDQRCASNGIRYLLMSRPITSFAA